MPEPHAGLLRGELNEDREHSRALARTVRQLTAELDEARTKIVNIRNTASYHEGDAGN
jgi:hypothetical protein